VARNARKNDSYYLKEKLQAYRDRSLALNRYLVAVYGNACRIHNIEPATAALLTLLDLGQNDVAQTQMFGNLGEVAMLSQGTHGSVTLTDAI
jgi:hypothetical protein